MIAKFYLEGLECLQAVAISIVELKIMFEMGHRISNTKSPDQLQSGPKNQL